MSSLNASRLWGVIVKNQKKLYSDYKIIYKQLLEFQLQGNLGNYHDWPYNSDDGWGIVKYSNFMLDEYENVHSEITAIQDNQFINEIHSILNPENDFRIAFGHVRNATTGSVSIPNPHPFTFNINNKTYSFAHNGTIDKSGLMYLLSEENLDSTWIINNPPNSYHCGDWLSTGFDCVVDSELYFYWIVKNILEEGDDFRGIVKALHQLENSTFVIDDINGEQRNFILTNGSEIFAYKSSDDIHEEHRYELYYRSFPNHFSIMSTPHSVDSEYIPINDQELIIINRYNSEPLKLIPSEQENYEGDLLILNDIINLNNLNESNCINCNGDGILEPNELGIQVWNGNRLGELNLNQYSSEEIHNYPSSIKLLTELNSFEGPHSNIIPNVSCDELPLGFIDFLECENLGCTNPTACNYNPLSSLDDGSCINPTENYNCAESCLTYDYNSNNCVELALFGCTDTLAYNYNEIAVIDDNNCMYDNIILLKRGNNLISLPGITETVITEDLMSPLENSGLKINFILGQGVGYFNVDNEWSGNLFNLNHLSGYWFNVGSNFSWHVPLQNRPFLPQDCNTYHLEEGNNLISYTGLENDNTINSLNGVDFSDNFKFILGQTVGLFNTESGWSGNLFNLKKNKGYWINTIYPMEFYWGLNCEESIILDSLNKISSNENFHVNQSTNQSFYLINEIQLNGFNPSNEDYILAYNNDELIGYANYSHNKTILPIMGKDLSEQTINYIESGETPKLKYYFNNTGKTVDLIGLIPYFQNLTVHQIDLLKSNLSSIPTDFKIKPIYPNPFNSTTTIEFSIPNVSTVLIELFDIKGKKIKSIFDKKLNSGNHHLIIETGLIPSGIYFVNTKILNDHHKLIDNNSQKILLIK